MKTFNTHFLNAATRSPPDGGSAAAGGPVSSSGAAGEGGQEGNTANAAPGSNAPAPSGWTPPAGLPEHLIKDVKSLDDFVPRLMEDWNKQRENARTMGERFRVPENLDGYKFDPSDKAKPYLGDPAKDPVLNLARDVALKTGIPPAMFSGLANGLVEMMAEKGMLPKAYDRVAEARAFFGPDGAQMSLEDIGARITPVVEGVHQWIDGQVTTKGFDADVANTLRPLANTAAGLKALAALAKLQPAPGGPSVGGQQGQTGMSREALKQRIADPRGDVNSHVYDKAFAAETNDLYKRMFG